MGSSHGKHETAILHDTGEHAVPWLLCCHLVCVRAADSGPTTNLTSSTTIAHASSNCWHLAATGQNTRLQGSHRAESLALSRFMVMHGDTVHGATRELSRNTSHMVEACTSMLSEWVGSRAHITFIDHISHTYVCTSKAEAQINCTDQV